MKYYISNYYLIRREIFILIIISFFIPETVGQAPSKVQIFDLNGRLVETLWSGKSLIGKNRYHWLAHGQTSGLYFVKLDVDGKQFTQKVQYIK